MNKLQAIDCMLDADRRLQEGWVELEAIGKNNYCEGALEFISLGSIPTILNLFYAIRASDKSNTLKVFTLEALACGLSEIAIELGFIEQESK